MSDRERWIMYPLLTFAISLAVKGQADIWTLQKVVKVEQPASGQSLARVSIACNELTVNSPEGRRQVRLGDTENGGALVVYNNFGRPASLIAAERQMGIVETFDTEGRKLVMLSSADGGGAVIAVRPEDRKAMLLGHHQQMRASGLFEIQFNEQNTWVVPRVGWVEVAGTKPANGPAPAPITPNGNNKPPPTPGPQPDSKPEPKAPEKPEESPEPAGPKADSGQ